MDLKRKIVSNAFKINADCNLPVGIITRLISFVMIFRLDPKFFIKNILTFLISLQCQNIILPDCQHRRI